MNPKVIGNHIITKSLNVLLPIAGIGLMLFYKYCDTSCSYLKGTFLGLDLRWVGIIFMMILLLSLSGALICKDSLIEPIAHLRTILISSAIGVELYLVGFQIINDTYCQFCLAFSACIFILFSINFRSMNRWVMTAFIIMGFLGFVLFFEGQVTPRFDL
jgi:hypothetical protein